MSSSSNGTASVESLAEVFRCYICLEKLRDARLCPHCSKLCCYPCIRKWLTDQHQHCPHCRAALHLNELVKCRWAEEVTTQIDSLQINETIRQKREEKDKCELHKEKLTVYCSSCSKCICHQCALFNGLHAGHSFLQVDDVYKTNISIINEHLGPLKRRQVEFICLIQDIERNIESIKAVKDERFREIRNATHAMQTKLDEQFKIKFDTFDVQRAQLLREAEIVERALHDIQHRLSTNGRAEVIGKQQDLLNSIQMICRKPITNFTPISLSCDFPSEIIPPYNSSSFVLTDFSLLQQNLDPVYSQALHANGLIWRLKVYPYGNGTVRGTYLSVFLELTNGLNEPSKYEYRIEMVHQLSRDPTKNIIREFASDFEVGECWGYNRYFQLNALITEGFIDTDNDTLILRFQVRPATYQQKSRDQQWYIKHLESDNQQLNNEIKKLREQLLILMPKKRSNEEILSTENHEGENLTEAAIDVTEMDDDDDDYTSLESDQMDSDEDENPLAQDDVEKGPTTPFSSQSTPAEQNLHRHSSHPLTKIPTIRSTATKSNPLTTNSTASNLLSDDTDDEVQSAFHAWRYESMPLNETLPFTTDEDFILADILERSANDQQNTISRPNNIQPNISSLFRPITQNNANESTTNSSEPFSYHTSLNNLMLHNSQQQVQDWHQPKTVPLVNTNAEQNSNQNNIQKK